MERDALKKLIDTAAGRRTAELVIKNCRVIDVYNAEIVDGDIAICGGRITGIGKYTGEREIDAGGRYASPGLIDSHIHVESSYVSPEELGRLLVPHGTTTIIADPHEIANVCGTDGIAYMRKAAEGTALDIQWMLPSCVPATPFEHSGAVIDADAVEKTLQGGGLLGLGEFMDFPGVVAGEDGVLGKLLAAAGRGLPIDGHSPGLAGNALNAYATAGIRTDHECATPEALKERVARGMYVQLRQGSACHDLKTLLRGVTAENSRRCLLCTDDCQPGTILSEGHLELHLRICLEAGLRPVDAIRMASLNAAECYGLSDRGALSPGRRADIVLFDDLVDFKAHRVFIEGKEAARDGEYLLPVSRRDISSVRGRFNVTGFSEERLRLELRSGRANVIKILPGGVVTARETAAVRRDGSGAFVRDPAADIVKLCVIERHRGTGNVAVALLGGYGIREGAVALSVAHDSHNIIATGVSDGDMAFAVRELIRQDGGIVLVRDGQVLERMPLPIGGLMSDQSGEWVAKRLRRIHEAAHGELGISREVEPIMTLCFMSLPVIPELKLTDMGLFDVTRFKFIPAEAE